MTMLPFDRESPPPEACCPECELPESECDCHQCDRCWGYFDECELEALPGVGTERYCAECFEAMRDEDEHDTRDLEVDCRETCGGPRYGV